MDLVKPVAPDLDGYLDKLKSKMSLFGSWNRRYFYINTVKDRIEYFHKKSDFSSNANDPAGKIMLSNIKSVKKFDNKSFQLDAGIDGSYILRAESIAQLTVWITGLETYVKARQVINTTSQFFRQFISSLLGIRAKIA